MTDTTPTTSYADLELELHRGHNGGYTVEMRFIPPNSDADIRLTTSDASPVTFDKGYLRRLELSPADYGRALSASLFAVPEIKLAFVQALSVAQALSAPLRLRIVIDTTASELHTLRWETLQDPQSGDLLLTSEHILFSRYLTSLHWQPVPPPPQDTLRALVVIANPTDLADYAPGGQPLTPFDAEGELARARASLGNITITPLTTRGTVNLNTITTHLRDDYDILYLVAHGALIKGEPYLWLEQEDGLAGVVSGKELVTRIKEQRQQPRLIVLASCQSALFPATPPTAARPDAIPASTASDVSHTLGPLLAQAGIPAILAMQGNVSIRTLERLTPVFFRELQRDGQIDRALAVARGAVRDQLDWWMPVLFMRIRNGRLWRAERPLPPANTALSPLEQRNRSRMLAKVHDFWIEGVLDHSLHGAALLQPGIASRTAAVDPPWQIVVQPSPHTTQPLPPGTTLADVFDDEGGELLLLGEPGAGKTTLLLDLARTLLHRATQDERLPIPVVFPLASWADQRQPLATWLVEELYTHYDIPRKVGQPWVDNDQIVPLLDGLDEVAADQREACVQAINAFRKEHSLAGLVVCSRTADYERLTVQLRLQEAVVLQPLTPEQAAAYLQRGGASVAALRQAFHTDATLRELGTTPLMLNILLLAYHDAPTDTFAAGVTPETQSKRLFGAYLQQMLTRRNANQPYPPQQTVAWLTWLAQRMSQHDQPVFHLEALQPTWLTAPAPRWLYVLLAGLATMLVSALAAGLIGTIIGTVLGNFGLGLIVATLGVALGSVVGLTTGTLVSLAQLRAAPAPPRPSSGAIYGLGGGLVSSLLGGALGGVLVSSLFFGLLMGIGVGLIIWLLAHPQRIQPAESIRWSWPKLGSRLGLILGIGLLSGFVGAGAGLQDATSAGLVYAVTGGLIYWLIFGLSAGLISSTIPHKTKPNEGMHRSLRSATVAWLGYGTLSALGAALSVGLGLGNVQSLGVAWGIVLVLLFGPLFGLYFGGLAVIQHAILRFILTRTGAIPPNYPHFLAYATDRILLHQVGGGYIFVHRLLQAYFAGLTPRP